MEIKNKRKVFHGINLSIVVPFLNNSDLFRPELNITNALCAYSSRFHFTCHVKWNLEGLTQNLTRMEPTSLIEIEPTSGTS